MHSVSGLSLDFGYGLALDFGYGLALDFGLDNIQFGNRQRQCAAHYKH